MAWAVWDRWKAAYPFITTSSSAAANVSFNAAGTNWWNTAAFDYFPDTAVAGDYLYFAVTRQYWGIKLEVGTPFAASAVEFAWEYKTGASTWATLRVSNPNALLSAGTQIVLFTPPDEDWYGDREKGLPIRCRIVSVTGLTEGGANATNKVEWLFKALQVTGTVTTLDSGVTADLAGSYTILAATTPAASLTPLRMPVMSLRTACKVDVVLAGGSAGAGDTVTLTGTDYGGNAVTEVINVSAGNGTYTSTAMFRDCTNVACSGWADGTIAVTQKRWGLLHSPYPGAYIFGSFLSVGDETTVSSLTLQNLSLTFVHNAFWYVTNNASFICGTLANAGTAAEMGVYGCTIKEQNAELGTQYRWNRLGGVGNQNYGDGSAVITLYGTRWYIENQGYNSSRMYFANSATVTMKDTQIVSNNLTGGTNDVLTLFLAASMDRCSIDAPGKLVSPSPVWNGCRFAGQWYFESAQPVTLTNHDAVSFLCWNYTSNGRLYFVNGSLANSNFSVGYSNMSLTGECIYLQYTFDLTVIDASGSPVVGANVTITDALGATVFSGVTDSNGQIAQQKLNREVGSHTAGASVYTWQTKTPHAVLVSASGYTDYEMPMTMDQARDEIVVMTSGGSSVIVIED